LETPVRESPGESRLTEARSRRLTILRTAPRAAAILIAAALAFATAHSQTPRNAELDRIRGEIASLKRRLDVVRSETKTAQRELETVDLELGIRSRELQIAVDMQAQLEEQQRVVEGQIADLAPRIANEKRFLGRRLVALYRMGGLSYLRIFLSIDDTRDPLRAISMLSYLVARDARAVSRFQSTREQLTAKREDLAERQRHTAEMRRVVEDRRRAVEQAHADKARLLASLQSQSTQSEKQLADLEEKAKRLERLVGVLQKQRNGVASAADIRSFQGALSWPVKGKVLESFGLQRDPKFATVTTSNGLKIASPAGAEVRAVFNGTVLFSQWFKGYGNLIILDHGNRVFSLYGNLKVPSIAVGDRVAAGQTIAGVGESEDARAGYLYFEIRQNNKPEDPRKWLR
jgi:septal ring factor EnvC (AmiA/AmiB activator)